MRAEAFTILDAMDEGWLRPEAVGPGGSSFLSRPIFGA
jgi:hypothetical protein